MLATAPSLALPAATIAGRWNTSRKGVGKSACRRRRSTKLGIRKRGQGRDGGGREDVTFGESELDPPFYLIVAGVLPANLLLILLVILFAIPQPI